MYDSLSASIELDDSTPCLEKNVYNYAQSSVTKEKTPMCRIAELARFNKLRHEYKLLDESGPAHQKTFSVSLVLHNDEVYEGSGASIKKAQQAAAANALQHTRLRRPPTKLAKTRAKDPVSPTVLLTRVTQALGLQQNYRDIVVPPPPSLYSPISSYIRATGRFMPPPLLPPSALFINYSEYPLTELAMPPRIFVVALHLGQGMSEVIGRGPSRQKARHNAAVQALAMLGPTMAAMEAERLSIVSPSSATASNEVVEQDNGYSSRPSTIYDNNNRQKSAISLVHECALQLRMVVVFEVIGEDGPAHERRYVIRCKLTSPEHDTIITEGHGGSKKVAKQNACSEMLTRIKQLESTPIYLAQSLMKAPTAVKQKTTASKDTKRKTIVKDKKMDPAYGQQINPVSRLVQVQQMRKQPEPVFQVIGEHGHSRYKEFHVEVICCGERCEGTGPNKKLAKRAAAEAMLGRIGYVKPMPMPGKSLLKKKNNEEETMNNIGLFEEVELEDTDKEEKILEKSQSEELSPSAIDETTAAGQIVKRRVTFSSEVSACPPPDDISYPTASTAPLKSDMVFVSKVKRRGRDSKKTLTLEQKLTMANMARAFLASSSSGCDSQPDSGAFIMPCPPEVTLSSSTAATASSSPIETARGCLEKMAETVKFSISYSDFPKAQDATSDQYFSLVTLGVDKPIVCHGSGNTEELAHDNAALNALQVIAGFNDGGRNEPEEEDQSAGLETTSLLDCSTRESASSEDA